MFGNNDNTKCISADANIKINSLKTKLTTNNQYNNNNIIIVVSFDWDWRLEECANAISVVIRSGKRLSVYIDMSVDGNLNGQL